MTVEWFDLGVRLRAAHERRAVPLLRAAPFAPPTTCVAVRVRRDPVAGFKGELAAADGPLLPFSGAGDLLARLAHEGLSLAASVFVSLLVDDRKTMSLLDEIARDVPPGSPLASVAAHLGWSVNRSDIPGTSAVVNLGRVLPAMFATGETPTAERSMGVWRRWLNVGDDTVCGLHTLLALAGARGSLRLLDQVGNSDSANWLRWQSDADSGYDWRSPDHVGRAAVGLAARCAAAEVYDAALLDDPLYRRRAVHSGHAVVGRVIAHGKRQISVDCARLDARLRPENSITGWAGLPGYVSRHPFTGTVTAAATVGTALHLTLKTGLSKVPPIGARVTLIPARPPDQTISRAVSNYSRLYSTRTSWLTTGRTPTPSRRDVPLEVLVSAADQE